MGASLDTRLRLVFSQQPCKRRRPRITLLCTHARGRPECCAGIRILEQPLENGSKLRGIDKDPRDTILDGVHEPAYARSDHGPPIRHRLARDDAVTLAP